MRRDGNPARATVMGRTNASRSRINVAVRSYIDIARHSRSCFDPDASYVKRASSRSATAHCRYQKAVPPMLPPDAVCENPFLFQCPCNHA